MTVESEPTYIAAVIQIGDICLVECLRCSAMVPEVSLPRHAQNLHHESVTYEGEHRFRWSRKR